MADELLAKVKQLERRLAVLEARDRVTATAGTWTPVLTGSTGGTATLTDPVGKYVKVDTAVLYSFYVTVNDLTGVTGNVRISLPLPAANDSNADYTRSAISSASVDWPGTPIDLHFYTLKGSSYGNFIAVQDNAAAQILTVTGLAASDALAASGFYFV